MTCIITGCTLRLGNVWVGGDLHEIGDAYVFNACLDHGEAAWSFEGEPNFQKEIDATPCLEYFERRGVAVFSKEARLNKAAREYLALPSDE